jgi:hypothetical protein
VDVQFDVLWRAGGVDTTIASVTHHYDQDPNGRFNAIAFETDLDGEAANARPGDKLVLRMSTPTTTVAIAWLPNGDGYKTGGRVPSLKLPR